MDSDLVLSFSGRQWTIKEHEISPWGPGVNYFSSNSKDIWVDDDDALHLSIAQRQGRWYSTELVSKESMGYGTYTFTISGNLGDLPENITLGLFTWNDSSFLEAGNSELDIEISKWGKPSQSQLITYAVQPIGVDPVYRERINQRYIDDGEFLNGFSVHEFIWTPERIEWRSYSGSEKVEDMLIAEWQFTKDNPARAKVENGVHSTPFVIPTPGDNTRARINFWIQSGVSQGPIGGKRQEIVIKRFVFKPY